MRITAPALSLCLAVGLGALAVQPLPARADTLLIERIGRGTGPATPNRGQSMASVRARFGVPSEELPPVGGDRPRQPPITRWVYPAFTVYFERERVIATVANRSSALEQGPKPVE